MWWLGLGTFTVRARVQSLVGKPRSRKVCVLLLDDLRVKFDMKQINRRKTNVGAQDRIPQAFN